MTTVHVSGQVGVDHATGKIPEDLGEQTDNALSSLKAILDAAGCPNGVADVTKLNT